MTTFIITALFLGVTLVVFSLIVVIRDMASSRYNRRFPDYTLIVFMACVIILFLTVAQLIFQGAVNASL